MNHTAAVITALDRLKRECEILWTMQERPSTAESSIHNRLILAQSKKVRVASNILVRAIARERDELHPHPEWDNLVRPMIRDHPPLQP